MLRKEEKIVIFKTWKCVACERDFVGKPRPTGYCESCEAEAVARGWKEAEIELRRQGVIREP